MRFLRTTNVAGMGYRPRSARNRNDFLDRATGLDLLQAIGSTKFRATSPQAKNSLQGNWGNVFNQEQTGACTAASTNKAARVTLVSKGIALPWDDFSCRFTYLTTRQIERAAAEPTGTLTPLTDSGAEPDDCITAIGSFGVVGSETVGFDISSANINNEDDTVELIKAAKKLLPGAYDVNFLSSDGAFQVQAINANGIGQTLALFVDSGVFGWDPNKGPITSIDLRDPQGGGHQVGLVGYYTSASLGLVLQFGNSWGTDWGMSGFGEITWNCFRAAGDAVVAYDVLFAEAA